MCEETRSANGAEGDDQAVHSLRREVKVSLQEGVDEVILETKDEVAEAFSV